MKLPLHPGADAAFPGAELPPRTEILAAYVGTPGKGNQSPDTPHIWTADEWNQYVRANTALRLLPIYVHNYDDGDPEADALNAIESVRSLGWTPALHAPYRQFIAVDQEVLIDPAYFFEMGQTIWNYGFRCIPYGSQSSVLLNPPFAGPWVAKLTRHAPTVLPAGWRGIQWQWGKLWNSDLFDNEVYLGCSTGPRHG